MHRDCSAVPARLIGNCRVCKVYMVWGLGYISFAVFRAEDLQSLGTRAY